MWLVEEAGAEMHAKDNRGDEPKDLARHKGHDEIVAYFEAREADEQQRLEEQRCTAEEQDRVARTQRRHESKRRAKVRRQEQQAWPAEARDGGDGGVFVLLCQALLVSSTPPAAS